MDFILTILGVLFTVLLALLGIEKNKNKKKTQIIQEKEQELIKTTQQNKVYEEHYEVVKKVNKEKKESEGKQEKEEEAIEDAQTDEEIIESGNAIIDSWNSDRMPDGADSL